MERNDGDEVSLSEEEEEEELLDEDIPIEFDVEIRGSRAELSYRFSLVGSTCLLPLKLEFEIVALEDLAGCDSITRPECYR